MNIIELNCVECYKVTETMYGLDVYEDDKVVCELSGSSFSDFEDEYGKIDESELLSAVYEQIDLDETMKKLHI